MVFKKLFTKKNKLQKEVDCGLLNDGYIECENCSSHHMLNFYKPLSFTKCSKCHNPIFIPYKISNYWLYKPLGSGGMGSVYKAAHYLNEDKYSIKLLQRDSRENIEASEALLREGYVGKLLSSHPNLCKVVEYGNNGNEVYVASKFLKGTRLDVMIDGLGSISEANVLLWSLQLLSALQHIYQLGYLYKDMKPQNIIINDKEDNRAVLFDYGLCEEIDNDIDENESHVMGSPMFLPPERCSLSKEGMCSEIYSLGMVLFYCLAGEPYYSANTIDNIIKMHTRKMRVKTIASKLPNVNPDIITILEKMVKRVPAERYQSYEEVYNDILPIYEIYKFG